MSLVFAILAAEVGIVSCLLLPLPPKLQKMLLDRYNSVLANSNMSIILVFVDALIGIMFVDAVKNGFGFLGKGDEIIEYSKNVWDLRAKKFYNQRNLYILGAIIALQACVWFIMMMLTSTVKNKTKLANLSKGPGAAQDAELAELKKQLEKEELDVKTLTKQYDSLWAEYQNKSTKDEETVVEKKDK